MDLKKYKNTLFYIVTGGFTADLLIITKGNCWKEEKSSGFGDGNGSWNDFISSMEHNFEDPLAILLAQIVMIIPVARLWLDFQKDQAANCYW
jgi:hypothetical protein